MGQAKSKGSRDERIAAAKAQREALKPQQMECNNCHATIAGPDIHLQDTRGMDGIEMVCVGQCSECGFATWGMKGDPDALAELAILMDDEYGGQGITGVQKYRTVN